MNRLTCNLLGSFAVVAVILVGTVDMDDNAQDWQESAALKALQATQAGTERRQIAAQALCNEARGPNSEARWMDDDSLVCTTRRGLKTIVAGGGK